MEPVTLAGVATAIATILLTKPLEKVGENIGDAAWTQSGKLIERVQLLQSTTVDNFTRMQAADSLGRILQNNQHRFAVVKALSSYWEFDSESYELAWECAQNMHYRDFYQAWHQHNVATRALQTLKKILFTGII